MQLTQLGGHVAQSGLGERQKHAQALMFGMANINEYVSGGVCYDAAAYVRYLLRADALIAPGALRCSTRSASCGSRGSTSRPAINGTDARAFRRAPRSASPETATCFMRRSPSAAAGSARSTAACWAAAGCMRSISRGCWSRIRPAASPTTARTFASTCRACRRSGAPRRTRAAAPRRCGRLPAVRRFPHGVAPSNAAILSTLNDTASRCGCACCVAACVPVRSGARAEVA